MTGAAGLTNIFLTLTDSQRIRDLVCLGTVDAILADPGVRLVILTPAPEDADFVRLLSRDRLVIRRLAMPRSFHLPQAAAFKIRRRLKSRAVADLWRELEEAIVPTREFDPVFVEFPPSLVVVSDVLLFREYPLWLAAKRRGVPTLGLIRSWDNIQKGLAIRPGLLGVSNEANARELKTRELYRDDEMILTGTPQFDPYFREENLISREKFFETLGLDPAKKLILFASAGASLQSIGPAWLRTLLDMQDANAFGAPTQIVCRNHPNDFLAPFDTLRDRPGLVFDRRLRWLFGHGWYMTLDDVVHVANLLHHADVVVTPASTMTIEAAIFDTPTLVLGFSDVRPELIEETMDRSAFQRQFKELFARKLVPLARSREEMKDWVARFLEHPELYRAERVQIRDEWCGIADGETAQRLANLILGLAREGSAILRVSGPERQARLSDLMAGKGRSSFAPAADARRAREGGTR